MTKSLYLMTLLTLLSACGGGGGGASAPAQAVVESASEILCDGQCAQTADVLSVDDVEQVLAQAIDQAQALGVDATIAVVDRVGNVLAVHRMAAIAPSIEIATSQPVLVSTGLEGLILPEGAAGDAIAAIAKALTGAYLSSEGNAFTTRTANQIVQEHFNPGERNQPAGPLFGVQFSQLACSDFSLSGASPGSQVGPQRSPLGLAADPGGFPLYKDGTPVGGIGVIADGLYSIDKNILDVDRDVDELIALAGTFGFAAPNDRRADRITVEGKTFRFSDVGFSDLTVSPENAPSYDSLTSGALVDVPGYGGGEILAGVRFGAIESGIAPYDLFDDLNAYTFYNQSGQVRYPPMDGTDDASLGDRRLIATEVETLLREALTIANKSRAQIRRPLGTSARVTVSIVDTNGAILGMARTEDGPVFGADVSLQKARTATFFSSRDAGDYLQAIATPTRYLNPDLSLKAEVNLGDYVEAARLFIGPQALSDGTAFSDRAGGNLSRPFYPDGIRGNPHGPFSKSFANNEWSPFSTGLQSDLVMNQLLTHVIFAVGASANDAVTGCVEAPGQRLANGAQIFPGSVPIYRGDTLIGGIGVSGDGIEQDDMISFLGVHHAGLALDGAINNAPPEIRADNLSPQGERLRYIQCPQTPFIDSDEQRVCEGK
ncbi:heme-binding protein [Aequoribacter sp.]|uniref:heme-binding protein n=1 Tax=Aequoribacter sp. TaxID=2847771 RepID=UPI003F6A2EC2